MVEITVNIAHPEKNMSTTKSLSDEEAEVLHGMQLGDELDGSNIGLDGYSFLITGGSDRAGFPMRQEVFGMGRQKVLIKGGVGLRKNREGRRVRRTVSGNTIYEETSQVNVKVVEEGDKALFEDPEESNESEKSEE